jgi:UDPglucose 6-dehydrogenase
MSQVEAASLMVARALNGFTTVVIKSTVPVGTGDRLESLMREAAPDADFELVSNPEFLREGAAIADFMRPDRIVAGADGVRGRVAIERLYAPLVSEGHPLLLVSRRTSELTKYAANCFLAMKVTFINELSDLSEAVGADVSDLARGIGLDPRIGSRYLSPGPGYGGSCFPKDIIAMVRSAEDAGSPVRLIETTLGINRARRDSMARRIARAAGGSVEGKRVAVLGLTFKANTDDLRESVSLDIIAGLEGLGATIVAHDPKGMEAAKPLLGHATFAADAYEAARGADVLVIATEWDDYRALDMARIKAEMAAPVVVDLRNLYDPAVVAGQGVTYHSLGRATGRP